VRGPGSPVLLAHGIGGRADLPLPLDLVIQGAAVALLVSFLAVILLWREPRLRGPAAGRGLPRWLAGLIDARLVRWGVRLAGLAGAGYVGAAAILGPDDALNPTPYVVFVLLWVGLVPVSLVAGPVWSTLNPVRTIHLGLSRLLGRAPAQGLLPYPAGWGAWPGAVTLFGFVWLELAAPGRDRTSVLLAYGAVVVLVAAGGALLWGDRWIAVAEPFEVWTRLVSRLAVVGRRDDGVLVWRNPLDGAATLGPAPGVVMLLGVSLGSTMFDSFSNSTGWARLVQATSVPPAVLNTVGLVATVLLIVGTFTVAARMTGATRAGDPARLPGLLAHSLLPIAVGYVVAHYFSYLLFTGQEAFLRLGDPLGTGADVAGLASRGVSYDVVPAAGIALVQVGAVVTGHVAAVISAHDRSVGLLPASRIVIGQLPMMGLMVTYTVGGLTLLFAA